MKTLFILLFAILLLGLSACGKVEERDAFGQANETLLAGDYDSAYKQYEAFVENGEFLAEAYRGMGICQIHKGEFDKACLSFERSLIQVEEQDFEFTTDVNLYLAYCRSLRGETDKAISIYSNLLKKESNADILYLRGRLYMQKGEDEQASADFERAAELTSDYDLFINIYSIYKEHQKDADGSAFLEKALEIANREGGEHYEQGLVHYYLQNYAAAKEDLIAATKEDPSDTKALLLLGRVYLSMDDIASARAMFKEHTENEKLAAVAYNGLALCEMADGNYEEALDLIATGLSFGDEGANQSLRFNEIVAYERMYDFETARTRAASYITYYPTDEAGLREMEFLASRS